MNHGWMKYLLRIPPNSTGHACNARNHLSLNLLRLARLIQVKDALREAAAYDVDPELSPAAQYMRKDMGLAGYKHLLSAGVWEPLLCTANHVHLQMLLVAHACSLVPMHPVATACRCVSMCLASSACALASSALLLVSFSLSTNERV